MSCDKPDSVVAQALTARRVKRDRSAVDCYVRRVRLDVSGEAAAHLDGQSRIACRLYNDLLEKANGLRAAFVVAKQAGREAEARAIGAALYTERGLRDLVPAMKAAHPFFGRVHSSPLKNAALRLSGAIRASQDSKAQRRAGPAVRWPRFKAWKKDWFSLQYEEPHKGWRIEGARLRLSFGLSAQGERLGVDLPMRDAAPDLHRARGVRIVKDAGHYVAVFAMQRPKAAPKPVERAIYLDPNSKNVAYGVDSLGRAFEFDNLATLKELARRCDVLLSKRDRCERRVRLVTFARPDGTQHRHWEPSRRWGRFDRALARARQVMRDTQKHHRHVVAHWLSRHYDLIGIGNWAPANADSGLGRKANRTLRNHRSLGALRSTIAWVAQKSGKQALVLDESGTTRTCCVCGHVVAGGIHPSVRQWTCAACGTHHLRDENAAQNGLGRLLGSGNFHVPRSGPGQVTARCRLAFRPEGRLEVAAFSAAKANENQTDRPESTGRVKSRQHAAGSDRRDGHRSKPGLIRSAAV